MIRFRPLLPEDQDFLRDVLHVALWDPPPAPLRPREVLDHPGVRIYAEGWGREGDVGVVALAGPEATPAGAAWMRLIIGGAGLAYVDERTPQLGIALLPPFQHQGYGEPLLRAALDAARAHGYAQVSLTVHPRNPAIALYERCGFRKMALRNTYHLMLAAL
jgi:ribosomal protein S18 acetylase RimI-like enzyme